MGKIQEIKLGDKKTTIENHLHQKAAAKGITSSYWKFSTTYVTDVDCLNNSPALKKLVWLGCTFFNVTVVGAVAMTVVTALMDTFEVLYRKGIDSRGPIGIESQKAVYCFKRISLTPPVTVEVKKGEIKLEAENANTEDADLAALALKAWTREVIPANLKCSLPLLFQLASQAIRDVKKSYHFSSQLKTKTQKEEFLEAANAAFTREIARHLVRVLVLEKKLPGDFQTVVKLFNDYGFAADQQTVSDALRAAFKDIATKKERTKTIQALDAFIAQTKNKGVDNVVQQSAKEAARHQKLQLKIDAYDTELRQGDSKKDKLITKLNKQIKGIVGKERFDTFEIDSGMDLAEIKTLLNQALREGARSAEVKKSVDLLYGKMEKLSEKNKSIKEARKEVGRLANVAKTSAQVKYEFSLQAAQWKALLMPTAPVVTAPFYPSSYAIPYAPNVPPQVMPPVMSYTSSYFQNPAYPAYSGVQSVVPNLNGSYPTIRSNGTGGNNSSGDGTKGYASFPIGNMSGAGAATGGTGRGTGSSNSPPPSNLGGTGAGTGGTSRGTGVNPPSSGNLGGTGAATGGTGRGTGSSNPPPPSNLGGTGAATGGTGRGTGSLNLPPLSNLGGTGAPTGGTGRGTGSSNSPPPSNLGGTGAPTVDGGKPQDWSPSLWGAFQDMRNAAKQPLDGKQATGTTKNVNSQPAVNNGGTGAPTVDGGKPQDWSPSLWGAFQDMRNAAKQPLDGKQATGTTKNVNSQPAVNNGGSDDNIPSNKNDKKFSDLFNAYTRGGSNSNLSPPAPDVTKSLNPEPTVNTDGSGGLGALGSGNNDKKVNSNTVEFNNSNRLASTAGRPRSNSLGSRAAKSSTSYGDDLRASTHSSPAGILNSATNVQNSNHSDATLHNSFDRKNPIDLKHVVDPEDLIEENNKWHTFSGDTDKTPELSANTSLLGEGRRLGEKVKGNAAVTAFAQQDSSEQVLIKQLFKDLPEKIGELNRKRTALQEKISDKIEELKQEQQTLKTLIDEKNELSSLLEERETKSLSLLEEQTKHAEAEKQAAHQPAIEELIKEMEEIATAINEQDAAILATKANIAGIKKVCEEIETEMEEVTVQRQTLESKASEIEKKITQIKAQKNSEEKIAVQQLESKDETSESEYETSESEYETSESESENEKDEVISSVNVNAKIPAAGGSDVSETEENEDSSEGKGRQTVSSSSSTAPRKISSRVQEGMDKLAGRLKNFRANSVMVKKYGHPTATQSFKPSDNATEGSSSTTMPLGRPMGSLLSNLPRPMEPLLSNLPRPMEPLLSNLPRPMEPLLSNLPRPMGPPNRTLPTHFKRKRGSSSNLNMPISFGTLESKKEFKELSELFSEKLKSEQRIKATIAKIDLPEEEALASQNPEVIEFNHYNATLKGITEEKEAIKRDMIQSRDTLNASQPGLADTIIQEIIKRKESQIESINAQLKEEAKKMREGSLTLEDYVKENNLQPLIDTQMRITEEVEFLETLVESTGVITSAKMTRTDGVTITFDDPEILSRSFNLSNGTATKEDLTASSPAALHGNEGALLYHFTVPAEPLIPLGMLDNTVSSASFEFIVEKEEVEEEENIVGNQSSLGSEEPTEEEEIKESEEDSVAAVEAKKEEIKEQATSPSSGGINSATSSIGTAAGALGTPTSQGNVDLGNFYNRAVRPGVEALISQNQLAPQPQHMNRDQQTSSTLTTPPTNTTPTRSTIVSPLKRFVNAFMGTK